MAAICSCAAATVLSAFALSQFIMRVMVFFISLSTFAVMISIAAFDAPIVVRKSAIMSACLKYSRKLPLRVLSFGERPRSSSMEYASRLTLWCEVASSRW